MTDVTPQGNVTQRLWQVWQQAQWKWQQQEHPAPRGLYLYGSVGVGKSFLMDLFHQSLVVDDVTSPTTAGASMNISCRRAHFHEFMLDVHQRIHEAKQATPRADVLPDVAHALAHEARVLCFDEFQGTSRQHK